MSQAGSDVCGCGEMIAAHSVACSYQMERLDWTGRTSALDTVRPRPCALTVFATSGTKKRYGRAHDGGYIIRDGLTYDHFLSGGISDDNSFERAILDAHPELTCDAYDPSSDGAHPHPRYRFHREPLGYAGLFEARNALVKIDIERAEWPWFHGLGAEVVNIAQLVIELHSPHHECWIWAALERLNKTHLLIHAHANNWDGIVEIDGMRVPGTLECTYIRKDFEPYRVLSREAIPGPLDMANDASKPDHVIDWAPFVDRGA